MFVIDLEHFEETTGDPEKAKLAAKHEEQARRDPLAENGISIDQHNFEPLLN